MLIKQDWIKVLCQGIGRWCVSALCLESTLTLTLTWRMSLKACCRPRYWPVRAGDGTRAQLVPLARPLPQTIRPQACATFSIFSWHLFFCHFFFYKANWKVTWGQCGRKVFIQVRQEHGSSFPFLLGPCEDDVGELQGILGQMFASKSMYVSMFLQLHPFCA